MRKRISSPDLICSYVEFAFKVGFENNDQQIGQTLDGFAEAFPNLAGCQLSQIDTKLAYDIHNFLPRWMILAMSDDAVLSQLLAAFEIIMKPDPCENILFGIMSQIELSAVSLYLSWYTIGERSRDRYNAINRGKLNRYIRARSCKPLSQVIFLTMVDAIKSKISMVSIGIPKPEASNMVNRAQTESWEAKRTLEILGGLDWFELDVAVLQQLDPYIFYLSPDGFSYYLAPILLAFLSLADVGLFDPLCLCLGPDSPSAAQLNKQLTEKQKNAISLVVDFYWSYSDQIARELGWDQYQLEKDLQPLLTYWGYSSR